ncbi:hypothetical protein SLA2020_385910 [Shorea laevis]
MSTRHPAQPTNLSPSSQPQASATLFPSLSFHCRSSHPFTRPPAVTSLSSSQLHTLFPFFGFSSLILHNRRWHHLKQAAILNHHSLENQKGKAQG